MTRWTRTRCTHLFVDKLSMKTANIVTNFFSLLVTISKLCRKRTVVKSADAECIEKYNVKEFGKMSRRLINSIEK